MDNKKPTENHSTTNTEVKMSADARRYTCFFSCMRSTTDDVKSQYKSEPQTPEKPKP